jgi:hypothetical protein
MSDETDAGEESRKRIIKAIRDHIADEPSWVIIPTLIEVLARLVIRECPSSTELVVRQFLEFCDEERKRVIEKSLPPTGEADKIE